MIEWHYEEIGENGEIVLLPLSGKLEAVDSDYLFSAIENEIHEGRQKLVIDCHGLEYISSVGLGMLLRLQARMKKFGGEVRLARVHGPIVQLLRLVKLDRVFHMYDSVEKAIE
jgi:anti-sigma B factor antagonist